MTSVIKKRCFVLSCTLTNLRLQDAVRDPSDVRDGSAIRTPQKGHREAI
jgi:hypothetical protein